MEIKLVADIHGEIDALRDALKPDDTLVILGDLLNWVDFKSLDGMLASILDKKEIAGLLEEVEKGRVDSARARVAAFLKTKGLQNDKLRGMAQDTYRKLFDAVPCRAYLLYGNVDYPDIMLDCLPSHITFMEAGRAEIGGATFGFVSGVPPFKYAVGLPGETDEKTYRERINRLGRVDILCTHFPPAYHELTFDVLAQRDEEGSRDLSDYVESVQPDYAFFGHVHQPMEKQKQAGRTKLVNTGFFRREKKVFSIEL